MKRQTAVAVAFLVTLSAVSSVPAEAGHELPYYPSYYPQEIRIQRISAEDAAPRLPRGEIHAFIGGDPFPTGTVPGDIGVVTSLGAYVIATLDGPTIAQAARETRCGVADRILRLLSSGKGGYTFHPYPVTPYHADYLHHVDLVDGVKARYTGRPAGGAAPAGPPPVLRAKGALAGQLLGLPQHPAGTAWAATVETVDVGFFIAAEAVRFETHLGPPWLKQGWFQAYRLLAARIRDGAGRVAVDAIAQRLLQGAYHGWEERLNLERQLVRLLTGECEAVVIGYTVKREYFNAEFTKGIENVAFDTQTGLHSSIFIRTAKLKEFPWNGWLRLGINDQPAAAWNPIAGFTDPFGRLVWWAVGDPGLLPAPYGVGWIPNRVTWKVGEPEQGLLARLRSWLDTLTGRAGVMRVPRDALTPEPGTGLLRRVGTGRTARTKIVYTALTSSFHDGSAMGVADLFYPYTLAYAWGSDTRREDGDRHIEKATALMRQVLVGVRVVRIDQRVVTLGDIKQTWRNPVVEVYLNAASTDPQEVAAMAPPWAAVPWHVMALMDAAVRRRAAAFSAEEAKRRGVAWLDLVRRAPLTERLAHLVEEFGASGYVPEALQGFVTADEARQRWRALKRFYQKHGHFLVTNGPYRLDRWTEDAVVLTVFRDLSYPLGIGSFDAYPVPRRGYISTMTMEDGWLQIRAEVELVETYARSYRIVREPLTDTLMPGALNKVRPVCRYVAIGQDGRVVKTGAAGYAGNGLFAADLRSVLPDLSAVAVAVYVDDNYTDPLVRILRPGK